MTRWSPADIDRYSLKRRERSAELREVTRIRPALPRSKEGFYDAPESPRTRPSHKNAYLYHASAYCRSLGVPEPVAEHYPLEHRDYRIDLAWVAQRVGLEVQGGNWVNGAHIRPAALREEYERNNLIVAAGWRLFYCEPELTRVAEAIMLIANSCLR